MQTPNFAIDTTAVDSNADRAQRFTSHRSLERRFGPPGSAARVPSDMSIWPPAALFDAVYASAVLDHFGFARISRRSGGTCSIWWAKNVIGPMPIKRTAVGRLLLGSNTTGVVTGGAATANAIDPYDLVMMVSASGDGTRESEGIPERV